MRDLLSPIVVAFRGEASVRRRLLADQQILPMQRQEIRDFDRRRDPARFVVRGRALLDPAG